MKTGKFFYYGKFGVLGIAAVIAFSLVVMWLWNWLVPDLFKGPEISYWQTLGLLILSKILFSGIGKGHSDHHHHPGITHADAPCPPGSIRDKWRQKFESKMNDVGSEKEE